MTEKEESYYPIKEKVEEPKDEFYLKIEKLKEKLERDEINGSDLSLIYDLMEELHRKQSDNSSLLLDEEFLKGFQEARELLVKIFERIKDKFNIEPSFLSVAEIIIKGDGLEGKKGEISEKVAYIKEWVKGLRDDLELGRINSYEHKQKSFAVLLYIKAINDLKEKKEEYERTLISQDQIEFLVNKIQETFQDDLGKKEKIQELDKLFIVEEENK